MWLCVYIYLHVCIYIYMHIHISIYVYICIHVYIYMCVCVCVCLYVCVCIGHTSQRLEIRIIQNIPSSIQTHTSDYTATPNSYNSNPPPITLAAIYWPIRPARAYTIPLCIPSWRHQQMNCSYPFWKRYLLKIQTRIMYPKAIPYSIVF